MSSDKGENMESIGTRFARIIIEAAESTMYTDEELSEMLEGADVADEDIVNDAVAEFRASVESTLQFVRSTN